MTNIQTFCQSQHFKIGQQQTGLENKLSLRAPLHKMTGNKYVFLPGPGSHSPSLN